MTNLIFVYGQDSFSSFEYLNALKKKYTETNLGDLNLVELDGAGLTVPSLDAQIKALPFLSNKRLIILRNLLTSKNTVLIEQLPDLYQKLPSSTLLVIFEEGQPDKRTSLFKKLNKDAVVKDFSYLDLPKLETWIKKRVRNLGGEISTPALDIMTTEIGPDLWRQTNEIDKLITYNPHITPESVRLLCTTSLDIIAFKLTDAILNNKRLEALSILDQLKQQGQIDVMIFGLIVSGYRPLATITLAMAEGITSRSELISRTKLHPFVVSKSLALLKKLDLASLTQIYGDLTDLDWRIKTGKIDSEVALDLLILRLNEIGGD